MCQIDNWLQFAYVANLLVRKHNYIKERIAKGESIEYISVRNPMVWAERNVSSQRNFCYRVIAVLFRNTSLFFPENTVSSVPTGSVCWESQNFV
jgi:hypothetical protein